jgi:hypothetical protein
MKLTISAGKLSLAKVNKVLLVTLIVGTVAGVVYGFSARQKANGTASEITRLEAELLEGRKKLAGAKDLQDAPLAKAPEVVGKLQAYLEMTATENGCQVRDFQAADQVSAYISRYEKSTQEKGWQQVDIRSSLTGSMSDLYLVLAKLAESPVPVEIDTVDLSRVSSDGQGNASVAARLEFRVLIQAREGA